MGIKTDAAGFLALIAIAVKQVGIATTLVNTLFMGFVAVLVIAAGIAFGLGGKDTAAEIVRKWYETGKENAGKIEKATEKAGERVEDETRKAGAQFATASSAHKAG